MSGKSHRSSGGAAPAPPVPLSQRSAVLEWRTNWFKITRSADDSALRDARNAAIAHKLQWIKEFGRSSGSMAGYDPAGTGSPWYSIGPRNVNGRVKALAVHPADPNTVYAGAASGGVWKSSDGGQTWDSLWDMQEFPRTRGAGYRRVGSPDRLRGHRRMDAWVWRELPRCRGLRLERWRDKLVASQLVPVPPDWDTGRGSRQSVKGVDLRRRRPRANRRRWRYLDAAAL